MGCPGSPELTLGEVGEHLVAQLAGRRFPLGGSIDLTQRCNLTCLMCYINQPAGSRAARAQELSTAQFAAILDQLVAAGVFSMLYTGGEPLLRPDFADLWRYGKRQGLLLSLFTNGTLLTEREADLLAEWRPTSMEITLYGATRETYERVTRTPGAYDRCMRGIELALARGLRLNLKSVLVRANRHEVDAMRAMAAGWGVDYRFDGVLWPRLDGGASELTQRLTPTEVVSLDQEYPERQAEYDERLLGYRPSAVRNEYVYTCGAGHRSFHIDHAGLLSLCMMARRPAYDLTRGSFQEGWDELGVVLRKRRTLDSRCVTCTVGSLCTQCPGWSQLVHGDDETPVDYVCEMGRLRAENARASVEDRRSAGQAAGSEPAAQKQPAAQMQPAAGAE